MPYIPHVVTYPSLEDFDMPKIIRCNGKMNPWEHILTFTMAINGTNLISTEADIIMVKVFGGKLSTEVLEWYSCLLENYVDLFSTMVGSFV